MFQPKQITPRIYYEYGAGEFYLCVAGEIDSFVSESLLKSYCAEYHPESELVYVDALNWKDIYDSGGFH